MRRKLLQKTDLHATLPLLTGVLRCPGVKADVLFFDIKEARESSWTERVWQYGCRANVHHTSRKKALRQEDLADFIACYRPENRNKRKATWGAEKNPQGRRVASAMRG
ncbi:N-6 DNA methylase [Pelagibius sp.]|uniref:N-6 DNA methylase n=1 Tax=Pelagibius sp. TaxID=1931238 RepID=UPI003BAB44A4